MGRHDDANAFAEAEDGRGECYIPLSPKSGVHPLLAEAARAWDEGRQHRTQGIAAPTLLFRPRPRWRAVDRIIVHLIKANTEPHRLTDPACSAHRAPRTWWQRRRFNRARGLTCAVCTGQRELRAAYHRAGFGTPTAW